MKLTPRSLSVLSVLVGLPLFVYLVHQTGVTTIVEKTRLLGLGFLVVVALSGARHGLRAIAWHHCLEPTERSVGLLDLFGLRLVGEAFNDITPVGPLLGETAKVWFVSRRMSTQSSASSVVVENLIYGLAAALFMLSGMVLLLVRVETPKQVRVIAAGLILGLLLSVLVPGWIIGRRMVFFQGILNRLKGRGLGRGLVERYAQNLRAVENSARHFFWTRRKLFFYILLIEILTNFTGVGECYLILKATTAHASVLAAYLVESANRAVQLIFAFVPFGLGVEEGAAAATLRALGYGASEGVSLAIIRKIRTLFWIATGLILLVHYSIPRPAEQGIGEGSA